MTEHNRVAESRAENEDTSIGRELDLTRRIEMAALGVTRSVELHLAEVALAGAEEEMLPDEGADIAFSLLRTSQRLIEAAKRIADQTGNEIEDIDRLQQNFAPRAAELPQEIPESSENSDTPSQEPPNEPAQPQKNHPECNGQAAETNQAYQARIEAPNKESDKRVLMLNGEQRFISSRVARLIDVFVNSEVPLARRDCYDFGYYCDAPTEGARNNAFFQDKTKVESIFKEILGLDNQVFQIHGKGSGTRYKIEGLELTSNHIEEEPADRPNDRPIPNETVKKNE